MEEIECLYIKKKITFKRKSDYFGSFAHRIGAKDSDIDLLIVGYLKVSSFIFIFLLLRLGSFLVLLTDAYQNKIVEGITEGIIRYFYPITTNN